LLLTLILKDGLVVRFTKPAPIKRLFVVAGFFSCSGQCCDAGNKKSNADVAFAALSYSTSLVKGLPPEWFSELHLEWTHEH
jgi:hypothetical protein